MAASYAMPDGVGLALGVLGFLLGIMWTAHLLACAWYVAGTVAYSDTGERWVDSVRNNGGQGSPLSDAPLQYQYMVAFSWAAGQIALGSLDVGPTNSSERAIFVLAMMLGLTSGVSGGVVSRDPMGCRLSGVVHHSSGCTTFLEVCVKISHMGHRYLFPRIREIRNFRGRGVFGVA